MDPRVRRKLMQSVVEERRFQRQRSRTGSQLQLAGLLGPGSGSGGLKQDALPAQDEAHGNADADASEADSHAASSKLSVTVSEIGACLRACAPRPSLDAACD
jgi:hypothetical protein